MRVVAFVLLVLVSGCQENFGDIVEYEKILGEVLDEDSLEPIEGARVTTNPLTDLQFSDENGRFVLDSLSSKIYSIRVVANGYQAKLASFNLNDIENSDLLILMTKDSSITLAPSAPNGPAPENGATGVPLQVELLWSADDDQDSLMYNVSFYRPGAIEPEQLLTSSLDTSVNVSDLLFNTTYFWQVEVVDKDGNSVLGPIWNFRTNVFAEEEFRYTFVRKSGGFDQIFIGNSDRMDVQITSSLQNHWRPTFSPQRNRIAYLAIENGDTHIFSMDKNGENDRQVTGTRPLRTKNPLEAPFSWSENGERIVYMDFDKILSITKDGTGLIEYGFESNGEIITSVDYSSFQGGRLLVTTEAPTSKLAKIFLYEIDSSKSTQLLDSLSGQFAHAQFSPSGRQITYSFNGEEDFSTSGIPLNKKLYYLDLAESEPLLLSGGKRGGTADQNPRFSGNGDFVVFVNRSSDGIGIANSFIVDLQDVSENQEAMRDTLFLNSVMIDWE